MFVLRLELLVVFVVWVEKRPNLPTICDFVTSASTVSDCKRRDAV